MVIKLPSLAERTLEERYELVKSCFKKEAAVVKTDISITSNALKALMLYECPGNIGQLKSDIKLSIAKAYLGYMMKRDEKLCVHTEDLPDYVRRGLFKYREAKEKIDGFITGISLVSLQSLCLLLFSMTKKYSIFTKHWKRSEGHYNKRA